MLTQYSRFGPKLEDYKHNEGSFRLIRIFSFRFVSFITSFTDPWLPPIYVKIHPFLLSPIAKFILA